MDFWKYFTSCRVNHAGVKSNFTLSCSAHFSLLHSVSLGLKRRKKPISRCAGEQVNAVFHLCRLNQTLAFQKTLCPQMQHLFQGKERKEQDCVCVRKTESIVQIV